METNKEFNVNDNLSFSDKSSHEKHGLRGHVQIFRENKETKEKTLWYEDDNVIPISGFQFVLMKIFGLYLDSPHNKKFENMGRDTTIVIPDLNNSGAYKLGVDPKDYSVMEDNISARHFVQGFMIGNGGSGEDSITTKNTDYSFTKLRNPIPFRQTQTSLPSDIAGKYLGVLRKGSSSISKSYYIKKFDSTPHIYHSWWREGQRWDYLDPVTPNDLGPDAVNGVGKTNRIETYAECQLSLDEDDCIAYFNHEGSTQTALINELGLVAFNTKLGQRSVAEMAYSTIIKKIIEIVFDNDKTLEMIKNLSILVDDICAFNNTEKLDEYDHPNITNFFNVVKSLKYDMDNALKDNPNVESPDFINTINWEKYQGKLSSEDNIGVEAFYNQNGKLVYSTDNYMKYLGDEKFVNMSTDEAERIKLITYYTFKSIPLQSNWKILINYRIYAN